MFEDTKITFSTTNTSQSVTIGIIDDTLIELPEKFYVEFVVTSNHSPDFLVSKPNKFAITITNNDGK